MDSNFTYIARLFQDSRFIELRHNIDGRWESGLYNDPAAMRRDIEARAERGALYTSLNRPDPGKVVVTNTFGSKPLTNADIGTVVRIPFDFDPVRPTGTSSTDSELGAACRCRDAVVQAMKAAGWPMPLLAVSGNGAHAVWRTNIKPNDDWRQGSAILYASIRQQFRDLLDRHQVRFDVAVRNPGRIWRLYGTINRKGEPTPERPYRLATCTLPAGGWHLVTPKQVQHLVDLWGPKIVRDERVRQIARLGAYKPGSGDYRTLDVVQWFTAHGAYRKQLGGHVHGVTCPWAHEHSGKGGPTETVIFETTDGWPGFFCHHDHCEGRSIKDVMALWGDADAFCARGWGGRDHG